MCSATPCIRKEEGNGEERGAAAIGAVELEVPVPHYLETRNFP
jgi:hypothetical protein